MYQEEFLLSNLIQKGVLKEDIAQSLITEARSLNKKIEEVMLEKKLVDEKTLINAKSEVLNLPIKLFQEKETVPNTILNLIPEDVARHYKVIAFNRIGDAEKVFVTDGNRKTVLIAEDIRNAVDGLI